MHLRRALTAVAVAAAVVVPTSAAVGSVGTGPGSPSSRPNTATTTDATGDVAGYRVTDDDQVGVPLGRKPTRTNADIRIVKVTHGKKAVRLQVSFRDLARAGSLLALQAVFATPSGGQKLVVLEARPGAWGGKATYYGPRGPKKCALTRSISYSKNVIVLVVPRSCLGNPRWVRVGVRTVHRYADVSYRDDGLSARRDGTEPPVLGPRLYP